MEGRTKGGDALLEIVYRIDERLQSIREDMANIREDVKDIKSRIDSLDKLTVENKTRIDEISDNIKTAKRISWTAIAGAVISFITGSGK